MDYCQQEKHLKDKLTLAVRSMWIGNLHDFAEVLIFRVSFPVLFLSFDTSYEMEQFVILFRDGDRTAQRFNFLQRLPLCPLHDSVMTDRQMDRRQGRG